MPAEAWERETGRKGDRVRGDSQRGVPGFEPRSLGGGVRGSGWVSAEGLACRLEWGAGVQSRGVSCRALDRCLAQQNRRGAFTGFADGEGRTRVLLLPPEVVFGRGTHQKLTTHSLELLKDLLEGRSTPPTRVE